MKEATFIIDSFGKNTVYEGDRGIVHQIHHLLVMKPGTDPLNPDKGIDIQKYYYEHVDDALFLDLQNKINQQITDYTPYTVLNIVCKAIKNSKGKYILHTFISLREYEEIINVSTNGEKSELATIKI